MSDPATDTATLGMSLVALMLLVLVSGLITGALARLVLPGPDPMSWGKTLLYGIGGSLLGGLVWRMLTSAVALPEITSFLFSVAGSAGLIWFFRRRGGSAGA